MISILCVGKLKEKYFADAVNEYVKRIGRYDKIEVTEIRDEDTQNAAIARKLEGERLLSKLPKSAYIITLDISGEMPDSVGLANKLSEIYTRHNSSICFVIGGSCGLDEAVKAKSDYALSFSHLTFPHQLFRVMLLEQLYRAFKINRGESYHK